MQLGKLGKGITVAIALCLWPTIARAQPITTDGTTNTQVNLNDSTFVIEQGTRVGDNLFHSFSEFSLLEGNEALFNNATDITNILTRVTGGNVSQIDGLISANGTANLFFLNPSGIIFGSDAQLNIGGSLISSTADSIKFVGGSEFSAINPQAPPLLAINVPIGLQYGLHPGSIVNQSQAGLAVIPGKTLALLGGDIILDGGNLTAIQGQIELGSVASTGLVSFSSTPTGLDFQYQGIENFGNIELSDAAVVNASGLGGGTIQIQGGQVSLTEGSRLVAETFGDVDGRGIKIQASHFSMQDRAFVSTATFGVGSGGNLEVDADTVELTGTTPFAATQQLLLGTFDPFNLSDGLYSFSAGVGAAGNLTIDARQLLIQDGANLFSSAFFQGSGGDMTLNISELAELSHGSLLFTGSAGMGDAGNLTVNATQLRVLDGTSLATTPNRDSTGKGGDLNVMAESIELRGTPLGSPAPAGLFTAALGTNAAGDLTVKTGELIVADGAQISATTSGRGAGGNLTVDADVVEISGVSSDGQFISGLITSSSLVTVPGLSGNAPAGDLIINTRRLSVRDGGQISAATGSEGIAGQLTVNASESVEVSGFATGVAPAVELVSFGIVGDGIVPSAIESNTSGAGDAGDLRIQTGSLMVRDGAEVGVRSTGEGAAGELNVTAHSILLEQGTLSAATISGAGGNITLTVSDDIQLRHNSMITTNVANSDSGNIVIDADVLVALENSDITANAEQGTGGRVIINAQGIFGIQFGEQITSESNITATSELGPEFSGTVEINQLTIDPSAGLVDLPTDVIDTKQLVVASCADSVGSTFVVTGRGGLPPNANEVINSTAGWIDWRSGESEIGNRELPEPSPIVNHPSPVEPLHSLSLPAREQQTRESPSSEEQNNLQSPIAHQIIEAQGWVVHPDGQVELVPYPTNGTIHSGWKQSANCQARTELRIEN
ncbi:MAG: S-layer family protein [Symploca sp. SIO3E6]|nr:S-layer family protein [Caldora sp. SIO3E6]